MRIGMIFTVLTLAACNGTDTATGDDDDDDGNTPANNYGQDFEDKFCTEFEDCSGGTTCPLTGNNTPPPGYTPPATTTADCDFNQAAADACLTADWECTNVDGFSFVTPAPECCAVCGGAPCPTGPI